MNRERMENLLRVAEGIPEGGHVDMANWSCCLVGWALRDKYFKDTCLNDALDHDGPEGLCTFFGLSSMQADYLFYPNAYTREEPPASEVVEHVNDVLNGLYRRSKVLADPNFAVVV